jgi:hypothetical protein
MGVENKTLIQRDFEDLMNMWKKLKEVKENKLSIYDIDDLVRNCVMDEMKEYFNMIGVDDIPETKEDRELYVESYAKNIVDGDMMENNVCFYTYVMEGRDKDCISNKTIISMITWMVNNDAKLFDDTPDADANLLWVLNWYFEIWGNFIYDEIIEDIKNMRQYKNYMEGKKDCGCDDECNCEGYVCDECATQQPPQDDRQEHTTGSQENS